MSEWDARFIEDRFWGTIESCMVPIIKDYERAFGVRLEIEGNYDAVMAWLAEHRPQLVAVLPKYNIKLYDAVCNGVCFIREQHDPYETETEEEDE